MTYKQFHDLIHCMKPATSVLMTLNLCTRVVKLAVLDGLQPLAVAVPPHSPGVGSAAALPWNSGRCPANFSPSFKRQLGYQTLWKSCPDASALGALSLHCIGITWKEAL